MCPTLPKVDLNFSLKEDIIPSGFYQVEVKGEKWCHFIFATEQQLSQLAATKTWYMDRNDLHQHVCQVCKTSAISIFPNVLTEKERLQEG